MDFNLPEELQMLKDNLRRFVDTELIPVERETNDGAKLLRSSFLQTPIVGPAASRKAQLTDHVGSQDRR